MWLIHQFDSLLHLGICKEYPIMAKAKTPRSTTSTRKKAASVPEVQVMAEVKKTSAPLNLEEEIRRRAYELYQQRGCEAGHEDEDWLVAEREVLFRCAQQQSA
jgi:hypothetical protein